jgi:hypothetical protein
MVTAVTVWKTTTGSMAELIEGGMGAKPLMEAVGAGVSIWAGNGDTMYYATHHENMAAWGKFRDNPIPGFNAYMQSLADEDGDLGAEVINRSTLIVQ